MKRTLCAQCFSGVSGDMFLGALIDLGADRDRIEGTLRKLPLTDYRLEVQEEVRGGMRGLKCTPRFGSGTKDFRTLGQVKEALRGSGLERGLVGEAETLFERLAGAEGAAHGKSAGTVHFHELGSPDTLIDVVGTLAAWRDLDIESGYASAVNLGGGQVKTSHGLLPVPAPATARLLEGMPVYSDGEEGEKTTPTGALLVSHLCRPTGAFPPMRLEGTGTGIGERSFEKGPNCLQLLLGEGDDDVEEEEVVVIETNIDDIDPQVFGYVTARLLKAGALESFVTPVVMKKGRPGHLLTVISPLGREGELGGIIFRETGTLGYRYRRVGRMKLRREIKEVSISSGHVRVKTASFEGEEIRYAPEYEDCRRIAKMSGRPLREVMEEAARTRGKGRGSR